MNTFLVRLDTFFTSELGCIDLLIFCWNIIKISLISWNIVIDFSNLIVSKFFIDCKNGAPIAGFLFLKKVFKWIGSKLILNFKIDNNEYLMLKHKRRFAPYNGNSNSSSSNNNTQLNGLFKDFMQFNPYFFKHYV